MWAERSRIPEMAALAKTLRRYRQAIYNALDHAVSNDRDSHCTSRWRWWFVVGGWADRWGLAW